MQSAFSVNHIREGNSLCNEFFFFRLLAFLSFDEVQNCQQGQVTLAPQLIPLLYWNEVNGNMFQVFLNAIKRDFQSTTSASPKKIEMFD